MKSILILFFIFGVSTISLADEIVINNCSIKISDSDFEKREDGSYFQRVDYSKFEYPEKEIYKIDLQKDSYIFSNKGVNVFKSDDFFLFSYIFSSPDIDFSKNVVVVVEQHQAISFFGFSIGDFKGFSKNCGFVFFESSIVEYNQWVKNGARIKGADTLIDQ